MRAGKARYVGISSYGPRRTEEAARILRGLGTPLLIHQPSYSMLNRWIEAELLDVIDREGVGAIVFSPLAQGLSTERYLDGVPDDSRVKRGNYFPPTLISDENLLRVRALAEIAQRRGQTLAQLAIAWALRDRRVTSALLGASSVAPARAECRRAGPAGLRSRRAGGDRRPRGRGWDQPLGGFEQRLRRGRY